jgi:uncharacterized protein YcaQ
VRTISPTVARRLAITGQRLGGERPKPSSEGLLALVRQLGCLQLDPTNVVAPSHRLVLWSRLGNYPAAALDSLQWERKQLFEYWAHAASIVLTEDYPIHRRLMVAWQHGETAWARRFKGWIKENASLKQHVLRELRRRGPLPASAFEDRSTRAWESSGWTSGRNVDRMLANLWLSGIVVVARRESGRRWWDLASEWMPPWTPRERLSQRELVERAAQRSLRALGVARSRDIERHFISGRYPGLASTLERLKKQGIIEQVEIGDGAERWPGTWYVHQSDVPLLDGLERNDWQPRTTFLSPFDNLIRDRDRTRLMFGFDYTIEIYVPAPKRKYGYYVLPVLHGDQLIGRLDAAVDRKRGDFALKALYSEDGRRSRDAGPAIAAAITELATFSGARNVTITAAMPALWKAALKKAL